MTMMGALHNLSRSLGCALLATSEKKLLSSFVGVEIIAYDFLKVLRNDFYYWSRATGAVALLTSFCARFVAKVIVDFSGCLHMRHPYELGGLGFTMSMFWAQAFPFVALQYFDGEKKQILTAFLAICFSLWLVVNIIFFCTIDLSYLNTFFGTKTAPQYTCELYLTGKEDFQKFDAIFTNRIQYTKNIHEEVKEWVAENLGEWRRERPDWFNIEMIPDELLPKDVFESVGGANRRRRRSSVSLREIIGLREASVGRVHPQAVEEMKVEDL